MQERTISRASLAATLSLALACGLAAYAPAALADEATGEGGDKTQQQAEQPAPEPANTGIAKKAGTWKYKTVKKKRRKVSYRFKDGSYPKGVTRIGKTWYCFTGSKGALATSSKKQRLVKIDGESYDVAGTGKLRTGWQVVGNKLMYFGGTGKRAVRNRTVGTITLSDTGEAIANLDASVKKKAIKLLDRITDREAKKSVQLRAAWKYLSGKKQSYKTVSVRIGDKTWAKRFANEMLTTHKGNCYGFAATFSALAKEIGYTPYVVTGRVPGSRDHAADGYTRHAAVKIGGRWYDPEAQFAGWAKGIYGSGSYPMGFKSLKAKKFSSYKGTGAPRFISVKNTDSVTYSIVKKGSSFYGYENSKRLKGLHCVKGKLYRFGSDYAMSADDYSAYQKAAKKKAPWKPLHALLGKPKKKFSGDSCYGAGTDTVYDYGTIAVSVFKAKKDGSEIVIDISEK